MIYCRLITHTIMEGDTLYLLARRYNTTVPAITLMNPGINPYNLQVGTRLRICMGEDEMKPKQPQISERELWEDMRRAFMGQGNWTKMFMDSVVFENPNSEAVKDRMMQSPEEMAAVFGMYLPGEVTERLLELMNEHTTLTAGMFEEEKSGNAEGAERNAERLYDNATETAQLLSGENPEFQLQMLEKMMFKNLDSLKEQMQLMSDSKFAEAGMVFDDMSDSNMMMADYMSDGLIRQFYGMNR